MLKTDKGTKTMPKTCKRTKANLKIDRVKRGCIAAFAIISLLVIFASAEGLTSYASSYVNDSTGYKVVIDDEADLLTASEETALAEDMKPITEYGNAMFVSAYPYGEDTSSYARSQYDSEFGSESGTVFVIDMANRNIYIFSRGYVYRVVTNSYADTITDNIYKLASREEYYECAKNAFEQEYVLLQGGRISQPMRYITNALMALILGVLINFVVLNVQRRKFKPSSKDVPAVINQEPEVIVRRGRLISTRTYVSSSSSSGGGGGGGGSSGGGGGGGGGGGHGF